MNKRILTIIGSIVGFLVISGLFLVAPYNSLVAQESRVEQAQAAVESNLQRRYDLIPNVVESVKGQIKHEEKVFSDIAEARAKIGSGSVKEQAKAQDELDSAVSRLLVLTESYPELKSNENINALTTELEGTENRILVARKDYNQVAADYNRSLRSFPKNIFAGLFGFEKKELFKADSRAETAPVVSFKD